jgi:diguanylate cyclase (GGDEF)-like protein/PAS domain S-box-containing protein
MPMQAGIDLSALIDSTEDFIWSVDLDFRLLTLNAALRAYYRDNYGVDACAGMRPEDLLPAAKVPEWRARYQRALAEGSYQMESVCADDRCTQLTFSRVVIDGEVKGISVFGRDMTELRAAEGARKLAEKNYRDIFNGALEGIYQSTVDGRIVAANPALATILGYDSPDEILSSVTDVGQQIWADPNERVSYIQKLRRHGIFLGYECEWKRKDGSIAWVSLNGKLVRSATGESVFHEGFITDISDRKRAEMRLRESEERYRATFEQAAAGMLHTSLDGRIVRCNEFFATMLGYSADEIAGKTLESFAAHEAAIDTDNVLKTMRASAETRSTPTTFEKLCLRKDGTRTWMNLTVSIQRDNDGRPVHFITLAKDINARKYAEAQLADALEALRVNEEKYRTTFEMSTEAICINRLSDGLYVDANKTFVEILGYERHEVIGQSSTALGIWTDPAERLRMTDIVQKNSACHNLETQFTRKDGTTLWGLMSASLMEYGGALCVLSVTRDISDVKATEERLAAAAAAVQSSEERYRTVFQTSFDGILINRLDNGQIIDVNRAFLDGMGFDRSEVIGKTANELNLWVNPKDRTKLFEELKDKLSCHSLEARFRKKNGESLWGMLSATITEFNGVRCLISITRDISEARAAEKEIWNLAFFDQLTSLPNRRMLLDRLHHSLAASARSGRQRALLFVDLDNFKDLNDSLGHHTGDLLLQEVAVRLTSCVREVDTVARLGGDEFVVMLEDLSASPKEAAAQAEFVGAKILNAISQPFWLSDRECFSSASIGITVFGDKREGTSEILQQADIAMYQAKAEGRGTMRFFEPGLQNAVIARAEMEEELRQAIKANQFLLYYQPQVDTERVIGAEALLRWKHPKRGLTAPSDFISLAEQTGLILPLGEWVLETTCLQIAAWGKDPKTARLSVAVNISAKQFCQPNFVEQVVEIVCRTKANPRNLRLELTESLLVDNFDEIVETMTRLKSYGIQFALDDFGTGYSSLTYLRHLPLDQLKIDRSFVKNILEDATSGAIAQTIISLGKAMGLPVIAEGVENQAQRDCLMHLGCNLFQGYLYSKPLPLEDFEQLLSAEIVATDFDRDEANAKWNRKPDKTDSYSDSLQ